MSIKTTAADLGIKAAFKYLRSNPEKAMAHLIDIADKLSGGELGTQRKIFRDAIENKDSNWHRFILRVLENVNPDVTEKLIANFLVNANLIGWQRQVEARDKYGCNVPWAILLDPTSACNLHCKGCWAADYGNRLNLSFDDIDSIIEQGKELGIFMYIYTGGEPLVRKKDIIRLCEKHNDCVFLCFTNATLIDEEFCQDMLRVGNFVPAISAEGNEETTDFRRGEGTYRRIDEAMRLLKQHKLPFGISCCYTSENADVVSSEAYYDQMIEWGALFVWFFHYMPVGSDANPELMPTPAQRENMYHAVREFRNTKEIFGMDFQNDGEYVQGCIAGGRRYFHINAAGDCDPCVFVHFSDSNIHEKSLLEVLTSPLFMAYHDGQPFNGNMLRPCPFLENPEKLREIIHETGAKSSNLEGVETVDDLCDRCEAYAKAWRPTADRLWKENPHIVPFSR